MSIVDVIDTILLSNPIKVKDTLLNPHLLEWFFAETFKKTNGVGNQKLVRKYLEARLAIESTKRSSLHMDAPAKKRV
jgi:Asp-tRNA(Asn)/Glu-tRNA(Gln) amidotransferase B subunit